MPEVEVPPERGSPDPPPGHTTSDGATTPDRVAPAVRRARRVPGARQVVVPLLAAALATAVSVPVTWQVATREPVPAAGPAGEEVPRSFGSRSELREHLLAQLRERDRDGTLLEPSPDRESQVAVPPARYRLDLICGLMRRRGTDHRQLRLHVRAGQQAYEITMPCPSTVQSLPDPLDFTQAAAGAISVYMEPPAERATVLLHLVPVAPSGGGPDA